MTPRLGSYRFKEMYREVTVNSKKQLRQLPTTNKPKSVFRRDRNDRQK